MQTSIDLAFADGVYTFKLGLPQISALQQKCGIGIGGLYARLLKGRYVVQDVSIGLTTEAQFYLEDVVETIRQGLIGGRHGEVDGQPVEVTSIVANRLVENYVVPPAAPLKESWNVAVAVMTALVEGYDPPKKDEPGSDPAAEMTTGGSITPEPSPTAP